MATLTLKLRHPGGTERIPTDLSVSITTEDGVLLDQLNEAVLGGVEPIKSGVDSWTGTDLTDPDMVPQGAYYQIKSRGEGELGGRVWYWDGHADASLSTIPTDNPPVGSAPRIVGPQGEHGIPGIQGPQGEKGDKGDKGDQGLQGPPPPATLQNQVNDLSTLVDSVQTALNAEVINRGQAFTNEQTARVQAILDAIAAHLAAIDPHGDRAYTDQQIANLIGGAPGFADTLGELQAIMAGDETAATALTNLVSALRNLSDPTFKANLDNAYAAASVPLHAGVRSRRYDPDRGVYNFKSSNTRKLRASLAKVQAGTVRSDWHVVGESTSADFIGTGYDQLNMWSRLMRDRVVSLGGQIGGTGFVPIAQPVSIDPRWSFTGSWSLAPNTGYGIGNAGGATATFSTVTLGGEKGTIVELWYFGSATGFNITVDGAIPAAGNVAVSNGSYNATTGAVTPAGGAILNKLTVSGLADATHALVVTCAGGSTYLVGAAISRTTGLVVNNISCDGQRATYWADRSDTTGLQYVRTNAVSLTPDVVFLPLGLNDAIGAVTLAAFKTAMTTVRNYWPNADVILVAQAQSNSVSQATWETYVSALYDLAETFDCPIVDLYDRMGNYLVASGNGLMGDGTHPNAAGQRLWATVVAAAIVSGPMSQPSVVQTSLFDAKGDLLVGRVDDAGARFPVGANNTRLVPDSSQPLGFRWSTGLMIEGVGSPLGVVTADPGMIYQDVTAASGFGLWYKQAGTGTNTSWVPLSPGDSVPVVSGPPGSAVTIDSGRFFTARNWTLAANLTVTMSITGMVSTRTGSFKAVYKQPASGGPYTVTHAGPIEWPNDSLPPSLPTPANAELHIYYEWTGLMWIGQAVSFFP